MTKKQKRKSTTSRASESSQKNEAAVEKFGISSKMMNDADFNPDYSAVIKDLKRIGILAGSFFTVLVVLSFFLR
jgi:hypothetical protein